ncbi:MAG: AAA family ATPase [Clostridia bacterium]|nr:AAA family ATPase [Clostridia bacterium]
MTDEILSCLPKRSSEQLLKYDLSSINEIRLAVDRPVTLTVGEKSVLLGDTVSLSEMTSSVSSFCRGSLHSFEKTMAEGYIPLNNGCRAGVCGKYSEGSITEITSVVIRIPRSIYGVGDSLCKRLLMNDGGMLLYSPPGVGKTTLLRDIASTLSSPPYLRRVSVIDSRNEIYRPDAFRRSIADIYNSYPKSFGIELAVRTMSPQYVVCDELGADEAASILSTQSFGVPLIASAHAPSLDALLKRKVFKQLDESGVFSTYVGITREGRGFSFDISERKIS